MDNLFYISTGSGFLGGIVFCYILKKCCVCF